jgi:hypothetical protein
MYEDNIFEDFEEKGLSIMEGDWSTTPEDIEDIYDVELAKVLALNDGSLSFNILTLQELKNLDVFEVESFARNNNPAEFYKSMVGMHGTKVVDGVEYAVMEDSAYHYFDEVMTVEVVDPQGKQCVMIYGLVDNWREVERQEKEKEWDPGEVDENDTAGGTDVWEHPSMIVSMIDFRNEIINRTALEFRKNGVPLNLQFLSKRSFMKEVLEKRAGAYCMPGIAAAFEKLSKNFGEDEHIAFLPDDDRIKIFYADTDETIEQMMATCFRMAQGREKLLGIGEICYDTFLDRVERALFELIFLVNKPADEIAFLSGVSIQELDDIRVGNKEFGDLTLKSVNLLMLSFPELLNLDQLLI